MIVLAIVPFSGFSQTFTATGLPANIPDGIGGTCYQSPGAPLTKTIVVTGVPGSVTLASQITINLNLSHTWLGDLTVSITPPGGSPINLIERLGATISGTCGTSSDFSSANTLSFNAANTNTITIFSPIAAGNYLPTAGSINPPGNLANLIGASYNGNWVLSVLDGTVQDVGQLHSFSIDIVPCPYPNYTFLGTGTNPTNPNDPTNWQSNCVPLLNDPNVIINITEGAIFDATSGITGTVINNGTLGGNLNLIGNLVNNGTFSPGN